MNRRLLSPRLWQRIGVLSALLWALAWSAPVSSEPLPLPPELQKRVNQAIDRGVQVLRGAQGNVGTWALNKNHMTGYAALPGLTLLECGVPASDPAVQRAAALVR